MARVLSNQALLYESGATQLAFAAMVDSGDHKRFTLSAKPWSQSTGYEPVIAPYGLLNGGAITPAAGNNLVDVAALLAMMPGATGASPITGQLTVNAATGIAVTRSATGGTPYQTTSITIDSTGTVVAVAGTAGAAQSETRGSAGGPPLIPVGSIEIGQIRLSSITAAAVSASEIFQVPGVHQERSDFPVYTADYIGGELVFAADLPLIHTGNVPKKVYAKVATPIFAEISSAKDWVPAKETYSSQSESFYDGVMGSASSSMGTAGFAFAMNDGVTDALLQREGKNTLFKFKPDKNAAPYQITQGIFSVAQTFGVKAMPMGTATIAAQQPTRNFAS